MLSSEAQGGELSPEERGELQRLLAHAIEEDGEDITSEAVIDPCLRGSARIIARQKCVVAGIPVLEEISTAFRLTCRSACRDGQELSARSIVATIRGSVHSVLKAERIMLNFLSRLSGIATVARAYVKAFAPTKVYDTRKTTPGWRHLEKYAVRVGGGHNHRVRLSEQILIKDNHLLCLARSVASTGSLPAGTVRTAVQKAKQFLRAQVRSGRLPGRIPIEVEVESEQALREAVEAGADIVMLDNWDTARIRKALRYLSAREQAKVTVELSGGIRLKRAPELASLGAERVAVGALTHSAPAVDFSLELIEVEDSGPGAAQGGRC